MRLADATVFSEPAGIEIYAADLAAVVKTQPLSSCRAFHHDLLL